MKVLESSKAVALTKEKAWMYQKMVEIRNFEDRVHELFAKGILPGFVHLYAGEEAVAVGVCAHLNGSITSTHRGHGHCIVKGCDLDGMMAEIFGKVTGLIQAGAIPLTWLQYLLELQSDWERQETYNGTLAIVKEHGGAYGLGVLYADQMFGKQDGMR